MLNYIWLGLVVAGILVAVGTDWHDLSVNKYHNGETLTMTIYPVHGSAPPVPGRPVSCTIAISPSEMMRLYGFSGGDTLRQRADFIPGATGGGGIHIFTDDRTPPIWKEIQQTQRNKDYLAGRISGLSGASGTLTAQLGFEKVAFTKLNAVTNEGIFGSAKTAVELAIGLIGIMALWLGLMKIAEQSGLVSKIARLLKPLMTRLFPDVPADHPAMGAMVMNISANMLGLANAATPLGLKAMEELNKLNPKAGTATDAMCTFLVINTSNVQLIPATVIAIRAASGSSNPAEILAPVLIATCVSLIVGVTVVKLLGKMRVYRNN